MSHYHVVEERSGPECLFRIVGPSGAMNELFVSRNDARAVAEASEQAFEDGILYGAREIIKSEIPIYEQMQSLILLGENNTVRSTLQSMIDSYRRLLEQ